MKRFNPAIFFLILLFVASSCEKDRAFLEFKDLEKGAYARLLEKSGELFLTDIPNSIITFSVEFYDENQGRNITSYDWTVSYTDKANDGANSRPATPLVSVPSSSFVVNDFGLPSTTITITLQQILDAFGFTVDDVNGGDEFVFNGSVKLNDGRVFGIENTEGNLVSSAAFRAWFFFREGLKCTSDLAGTFDFVTVPWCDAGATSTGVTIWEETSLEGVYNVLSPDGDPQRADFSYGAYDVCYGVSSARPLGSLQVQDVCNGIRPIGASQWGELYWYNAVSVSGDGKVLTIDWENDYGEAGVTELTRQDGREWPPLKN